MNHEYDDENAQVNAQFNAMTDGIDPQPYGPAPEQPAKKAGLNARGKVVLAGAAVVLAGSGVIGYTIHTDNAAENANKAAELAIQQQKLDLERIKVTNQIDEKQAAKQQDADKAIQAKVEACVDQNKDGSAYLQGVVDACKEQYNATDSSTDGGDMQAAGAASSSGGGDSNTLVLAGIAAAVVGTGVAVRRLSRPTYAE